MNKKAIDALWAEYRFANRNHFSLMGLNTFTKALTEYDKALRGRIELKVIMASGVNHLDVGEMQEFVDIIRNTEVV